VLVVKLRVFVVALRTLVVGVAATVVFVVALRTRVVGVAVTVVLVVKLRVFVVALRTLVVGVAATVVFVVALQTLVVSVAATVAFVVALRVFVVALRTLVVGVAATVVLDVTMWTLVVRLVAVVVTAPAAVTLRTLAVVVVAAIVFVAAPSVLGIWQRSGFLFRPRFADLKTECVGKFLFSRLSSPATDLSRFCFLLFGRQRLEGSDIAMPPSCGTTLAKSITAICRTRLSCSAAATSLHKYVRSIR